MRKRGILLPVFSLPSPYGIGCFSREAEEFIDQLARARQSYWQMLPLCPAGKGDSPYQPHSSFAGNPIFIDPQRLYREGLLDKADLRFLGENSDDTEEPHYIDYLRLREPRKEVLRRAYMRSKADPPFEEFCIAERDWLENYAFYAALKDHFGGMDWDEWPMIGNEYYVELADEIDFQKWMQYQFFRQWHHITEYAHYRGIEIIGDIPIYAAYESADCWSHPELFQLDDSMRPTAYSGAPPDGFAPQGQMWGNPLYDWEYQPSTGYSWWKKRIRQMFRMFDVVRLDHTRGFESYYSIPADTRQPADGHWEKGPGLEFLKTLQQAASEMPGDCRFIAEDLGYLTPEVKAMISGAGLPSMKVLQFGFDGDPANVYLPDNFENDNCVVYPGTHDNDTTVGWFQSLNEATALAVVDYINRYLSQDTRDAQQVCDGMVRIAMSSRARTCIVPLQDYLALDSSARINVPGTGSDNWDWRLMPGMVTGELLDHIAELTTRYDRLGSRNEQ